MKRKDYEKPTMQVVKLHHHGMLMTSGEVGTKSSINGWGNGGTTNDEVEL